MSSKTTPLSLELFSFFKQLAGLIEELLDLGPTTDRQILKSTYLRMSLPKIPTLVEPKPADPLVQTQNIYTKIFLINPKITTAADDKFCDIFPNFR